MCVSLPAKIISVKNKKSGKKIIAQIGDEKIEVSDFLVKAKKGDFVYIRNNLIMGKISGREANEVINLFK